MELLYIPYYIWKVAIFTLQKRIKKKRKNKKNHKKFSKKLLFFAFFASKLSVLKNLPCTLPQTYFEDYLMFFKSKSVENSFQTKDPTWLIVLGSLTLFATCIFCALDGASLSSSLSFALVILLNIPIYVGMFKYEPDFENSNDYYLCDSELYKLSGYEEVPILDKNSNYKFTEATRLIDRHIESQKEENRNREDYVPINLNKDDIAALTMVAAKNITNKLFIGYGYEFLPKHARRLAKLQEQGLKQLPHGKGSAQIHNLERRHKPLFMSLQNIKDHAIVFGTTGSGKTRFFDLLITQAIERNDTVIIIDPKGDHDLKRRARRICACTHRDGAFHVLDVKDPNLTTSAFNLFGSSTSASDIADKLTSLMKQSTFDTDSFASYGQEAVACAVTALDCLDLPVDIYHICNHANIESYFDGMVAGLSKLTAKTQNRDLAVYFARLLKGYSIEKHLYTHVRDFLVSIGDEAQLDGISDISEDSLLDPEVALSLTPEQLSALKEKVKAQNDENNIVEAQIADTDASSGTNNNADNGSNKTGNFADNSNTIKTETDSKETEVKPKRRGRPPKKKVEDTTSATAVDTKASGTSKNETKKTTAKKRTAKPKNVKIQVKAAAFLTYYKYLKQHSNLDIDPEFDKIMSILQAPKFDKVMKRRKVSIFIDEASEVVNEALLQLLNKARGADFSITIATQTFSDLAKRCGSKDAAMQLIGNCNTMYSLRVKDEETASVITSSLPNTTFYTKNISTGTMSDTYKENYKDSASISANTYIDRIFPSSALMELPNFEYVAKLSDGRFVKGVIPILTDNKLRD